MIIFLFTIGVLSYLFGTLVVAGAKSSIHETLAMASFVNGTVAIAGAVIARRVEAVRKQIAEESERFMDVGARKAIREFRHEGIGRTRESERYSDERQDTRYQDRRDPEIR